MRIFIEKFRPTTPVGKELGAKYDELLAGVAYLGDELVWEVWSVCIGIIVLEFMK
ncbi:MAG: hypothetical protein F6K40_03510 [Okeania sp. SIO3I5]|uniref:hypothetical protein n=1 Tax=Okeania sp. SIO3I5 TaxID=2607805 RepID=UPI0013B5B41F|nr:hypothetical protein [Okeania sp. SIO3I5]NEQ35423.1 hypothetical protein [Okeania sp. SIO3I5]